MEKGTKIIDIRDGKQYVVESVDHYETVTLVYTECKKYIPETNVRDLSEYQVIIDAVDNSVEYIRENITKKIEDAWNNAIQSFNKKFEVKK